MNAIFNIARGNIMSCPALSHLAAGVAGGRARSAPSSKRNRRRKFHRGLNRHRQHRSTPYRCWPWYSWQWNYIFPAWPAGVAAMWSFLIGRRHYEVTKVEVATGAFGREWRDEGSDSTMWRARVPAAGIVSISRRYCLSRAREKAARPNEGNGIERRRAKRLGFLHYA